MNPSPTPTLSQTQLAGALYRCEFSSLKERNRTDHRKALWRRREVQGGHRLGLEFLDLFSTAVFPVHPHPHTPNRTIILATQQRLGFEFCISFPTFQANSFRVAG